MNYEEQIETIEEMLRELKEEIEKGKEKKVYEFTEDEKVILRNASEDYKWISREKSGTLIISENKPKKTEDSWICSNWEFLTLFEHIFNDIQWEDDEPCEFRKYI